MSNTVTAGTSANSNVKTIEVRGVSRVFHTAEGTNAALRHIDLTVQPGEFVSLIGPSGCGKTTLLKLIAGFDEPSGGRVLLGGRPATEALDASVGYLFQKPNLFPWLRLYDNIVFGAREAGVYPDAAALRTAAERVMLQVGLDGRGRLYPHEVSGGMASRAALARVLLARPGVLLMDEPFASLDALTKVSMHRLLREVLREDRNTSTVLITHDITEALVLSDRILVMAKSGGDIIEEVQPSFRRTGADVMDIEETPDFVHLRRRLTDLLAPPHPHGSGETHAEHARAAALGCSEGAK